MEHIDKERLRHAAEVANIHGFIEELPLGYNTRIGQEGHGLSQGQKQRILIARAVYKSPEFIFFDEATNALDANNERIIMDNLQRFFEGQDIGSGGASAEHRAGCRPDSGDRAGTDSGNGDARGTDSEGRKVLRVGEESAGALRMES